MSFSLTRAVRVLADYSGFSSVSNRTSGRRGPACPGDHDYQSAEQAEPRSKDIAKNNCFKMSVIARLDRAIQ
jgi:hypothetical protein